MSTNKGSVFDRNGKAIALASFLTVLKGDITNNGILLVNPEMPLSIAISLAPSSP
jgi:hypothetical protein